MANWPRPSVAQAAARLRRVPLMTTAGAASVTLEAEPRARESRRVRPVDRHCRQLLHDAPHAATASDAEVASEREPDRLARDLPAARRPTVSSTSSSRAGTAQQRSTWACSWMRLLARDRRPDHIAEGTLQPMEDQARCAPSGQEPPATVFGAHLRCVGGTARRSKRWSGSAPMEAPSNRRSRTL